MPEDFRRDGILPSNVAPWFYVAFKLRYYILDWFTGLEIAEILV